MPTTIDSLAIDINAEAGDVSSKIDALATKLGKLATSIGSVNGTGLVNISAETLKIIIGCLLIVVCAIPNLKQVLADAKEAKRGKASLL